MTAFFDRNIAEIQASQSLRWFGLALALVHLFTFLLWPPQGEFLHSLIWSDERICWPFLPGCEAYTIPGRWFSPLLFVFLFLSLAAALLFLHDKIRSGYFVLLAAFLLKLFIYFQDYRLMGNYHYMHHFAALAFFFLPDKRRTLPPLLVIFYLGAASLKFNLEWLSGAALLRDTFLKGKWLEWACTYVVVLESVLIFDLLSSSRRIFILTLTQLAVFHGFSFFVVGFYYPLVMTSLLSFPVLLWVLNERPANPFHLHKFSAGFLVVLLVFQFLPHVLTDRPDLDGRGRLLALNMLDSMPTCEAHFVARFNDHTRELPLQFNVNGPRLRCDVIVMFAEADRHCRELQRKDGFQGMSFSLVSRRLTDLDYRTVYSTEDHCRDSRRLSWLGSL